MVRSSWVLALFLCLFAFGVMAEAPLIDLDRAIGLALANSVDIRANRAGLAGSRQANSLKIRALLPQLSVDANSVASIVQDGVDSRLYKFGGRVSQLLFDGGRFIRQDELGKLEYRAGTASLEAAESDLADQVRSLARQTEVQRQTRLIQEQTLVIARDQSLIARKEYELGSGIELDAIDAELNWRGLEADAAQTDVELAAARQQLAQLLGVEAPDGVVVQVDVDADYRGLALEPLVALLAERAGRDNSGLEQQDLAIAQARLKLAEAQWAFLPTVSLEASLSLSGSQFPLQQPEWSARLVFELPVPGLPLKPSLSLGGSPGLKQDAAYGGSVWIGEQLDMGLNVAQLTTVLWSALEKRRQAEAELRRSLDSLLATYRLKVRQLSVNRQLVATTARRVGIMARQLDIGEIKRIDYLQAQTKLAQCRIGIIKAVAEILAAERGIEKATGMPAGSLALLAKPAE
jgi:outer membrane protein TolC